jgi:hypothetical protein
MQGFLYIPYSVRHPVYLHEEILRLSFKQFIRIVKILKIMFLCLNSLIVNNVFCRT